MACVTQNNKHKNEIIKYTTILQNKTVLKLLEMPNKSMKKLCDQLIKAT